MRLKEVARKSLLLSGTPDTEVFQKQFKQEYLENEHELLAENSTDNLDHEKILFKCISKTAALEVPLNDGLCRATRVSCSLDTSVEFSATYFLLITRYSYINNF